VFHGTVHVCHLIHSLGPGGAEQVLVDLATVAGDVGLRMTVLALVDHPTPVHEDDLRRAGVEVRNLGLGSRWDPRAFVRAERLVAEVRPDLLHTHLKHADLVGGVVATRLGLPQVSTLHVIEEGARGVALGKRWLAGRLRSRIAARTIAVSAAQREWYLSTFRADPSSLVTLYNGVVPGPPLEPSERTALRATLGADENTVLAANVSIMRPGKGHVDLLKAMAQLPPSSPVRLVLIGDGPCRSDLEQLATTDPALTDRVLFAGYRTDIATVIQAADVIVHPSYADALPTALIHALAAGLPVIAYDVGGIPEIVGSDAGVLLPVGSVSELARTTEELAGDPAARARMGSAGRARFAELFDAKIWAENLVRLYDEVRS